MITLDFRHRLGNNLFQWAAAYALARRTGDRLAIPPWQYANDFGLPVTLFQPLAPIYREPSFSYTPIPHKLGEDIRLRGYFQSEKYFSDYIGEVREMLGPFEKRDVCAVHVRRTDYVNNPHYANLSFRYYERAMRNVPMEFLFFSDDIDYCEKAFGGLDCVSFSRETDPVKDLRKMAGCERIIGSNSTFSLWAAILSGHDRCTFPKAWFAGPSLRLYTKDLIPQRFTILETE